MTSWGIPHDKLREKVENKAPSTNELAEYIGANHESAQYIGVNQKWTETTLQLHSM